MGAKKPMAKLKDLAAKAGRWLGLAAATPALHTQAIEADRFDQMMWSDTYGQAAALRGLADDLADRHDYTGELLRDVWTGAYKVAPRVRGRHEMDPSRQVNHEVVSALLDSPEFGELRRDTVGDSYASAMAVLSQGQALRGMLEHSREAREAAQQAMEARQEAAQAAQAVQAAMQEADQAADSDGNVPAGAGKQLADAIAAAEAADQAADQADSTARQALAQAAPRLRKEARAAAAEAAEQARAEAELMAAWGLGPGELQRMPFADRAQLAERLRGNRLGDFAKLIGRFRQMAAGERARRVEHAPGELVGITVGDDLSKVIPSELAALAVPVLRAEFVARLAEGRLLAYDSAGEETAGDGAIIALVDCSSSMTHEEEGGATREAWAKACALALLDQARAGKRDFVGILFASAEQQQVFAFPKGRADIGQVLEFGEHFFGGGTSFAEPLDLAADVLAENWDVDEVRHGDIVLITDGECKVTSTWLEQWRQRKEAVGFRVFGVAVSHRPGQVLGELCDNLRHITDLADLDGPRDLFRLI